jgi:ferredoxin
MWKRHLRRFRVGVALFSLIVIAGGFLDCFGLLPTVFIRGILYFQFIPSLMKGLGQFSGAWGVVVVLGVTLMFGRVYCSFLCPLGGFMDAMNRIAGRKRRPFARSHSLIRYSILGLTAGVFLAGSLWLINILDPYSIFGRLAVTLGRPVVVTVNNGVSRGLEILGIYTVAPLYHTAMPVGIVFVSLTYLGVIAGLSFRYGRIYCNTICPVGTFLGILARIGLIRPVIEKGTCSRCGRCERICKADCIDSLEGVVDVSRCVCCFNCIDTCPEGSLTLGTVFSKSRIPDEGPVDHGRRFAACLLALLIAGFPRRVWAELSKPFVFARNTVPVKRTHPVTPPGSRSIRHFSELCTACYLCVSRCPGRVIKPGYTDFGWKGVLMPHMSASEGFCNYTCTECGKVCPTGAIQPLGIEEKQTTQIGRVVFIRENCIVITQKTECGACSEHCPTKAVTMVVENNLRVPSVIPDICIGCGACEHACPSLPHKSIFVDGNSVHLKVRKPQDKPAESVNSGEAFPF